MSSLAASRATVQRRVPLRLPLWFALSLTVCLGLFAWWAIGSQDWKAAPPESRDYLMGPYQVPVTVLWVVGAIAALGVLGGLVRELVRFASRRTDQDRLSLTLPVASILVYVGVVAAASWRAITAGVVGANIGGGMLLVGTPIYIAWLLLAASVIERSIREGQMTSKRGAAWALGSAAAPGLVIVGLVFAPVVVPVLSVGYIALKLRRRRAAKRERTGML